MHRTGDMQIAGSLTAADWARCKASLVIAGPAAPWEAAFDNFFDQRLSTRYFEPIRTLETSGTLAGEGFSIVAIQCSLIEFIGSMLDGTTHRPRRRGVTLGPFEYSDSRSLFLRVLTSVEPFRASFNDAQAADFYEGVRCGLLHEARTKNGWRIHVSSTPGPIIDAREKIVWRDNFQRSLEEFVAWYRSRITQSHDYQRAFIRKYDALSLP